MELTLTKKQMYQKEVNKILANKELVGRGLYEIGLALNRIKAQELYLCEFTHWETFLEKKVEISQRTAQRFMRVAKEFTLRDYLKWGMSRLDIILEKLPDFAERDDFLKTANVGDSVRGLPETITQFKTEKGIEEQEIAVRRSQIGRKARTDEEQTFKLQREGTWLLSQIALLKSNKSALNELINKWLSESRKLDSLKPLAQKVIKEWY